MPHKRTRPFCDVIIGDFLHWQYNCRNGHYLRYPISIEAFTACLYKKSVKFAGRAAAPEALAAPALPAPTHGGWPYLLCSHIEIYTCSRYQAAIITHSSHFICQQPPRYAVRGHPTTPVGRHTPQLPHFITFLFHCHSAVPTYPREK